MATIVSRWVSVSLHLVFVGRIVWVLWELISSPPHILGVRRLPLAVCLLLRWSVNPMPCVGVEVTYYERGSWTVENGVDVLNAHPGTWGTH
ncbi:hypothetical protein EVAR_80035_1 [Eumeta japonica]|uniref:Uncharacterized protein n=1 Tax=Eumeta variegata TaxID=151549 RepID=A0A4C1WM67_EUMVA|nr:hypothetical protein EVAR_80035_1 [Eumeta japonica]